MKEKIKARARELGFDDCRFTTANSPATAPKFLEWLEAGRHGAMEWLGRNANKRVSPREVLGEARTIIILAASYHLPSDQPAPGDPRTGVVARYARFADYHDVLGPKLRELAAFVNELGGPSAKSLWYVDTGPILERDLAQRAGVGFIGKHTNLISRGMGNWFLLAEILTSVEIEPDAPEHNRCGTCRRCIVACPTQAITAPFSLDARRCISYLTIELKGPIPEELRPAIGNRIFGCDDCLEVCPWNRFAVEGRLMREHAMTGLGTPDLIELLSLNDPGFKARFIGTPILRAKRRGLLRNVCVALGNVGDASALPALSKAAGDAEPLIAEHAAWAIHSIEGRLAGQKT